MRDEDEIDAAMDEATVRASHASRFPGMTYEQGVRDTLDWVLSEDAENPLEQT